MGMGLGMSLLCTTGGVRVRVSMSKVNGRREVGVSHQARRAQTSLSSAEGLKGQRDKIRVSHIEETQYRNGKPAFFLLSFLNAFFLLYLHDTSCYLGSPKAKVVAINYLSWTSPHLQLPLSSSPSITPPIAVGDYY